MCIHFLSLFTNKEIDTEELSKTGHSLNFSFALQAELLNKKGLQLSYLVFHNDVALKRGLRLSA